MAAEYKHFCNTYGWYKVVSDMADGKIYLFDTIVTLPCVDVFAHLIYLRDKHKAEQAQAKLIKEKNGNR